MEENNVIEQKESITLSTTAKGLYQFDVKVRDVVLNDDTLNRLNGIMDKLILKYPNNVITANKSE